VFPPIKLTDILVNNQLMSVRYIMIKIFVDLDSTLTNFEKAVRDLGETPATGLSDNATDEQKQAMYKAIDDASVDFWATMEWIPDGYALWELLKPYNPVLLSSPGEFRDAPGGKQEWVNKNIPGTSLILDPKKWNYAERNAILIDDNQNNIGAWEECGGIGILHTDAISTAKKLLNLIRSKPLLTIASAVRNLGNILLSEQ